jgi:hypothetical protein
MEPRIDRNLAGRLSSAAADALAESAALRGVQYRYAGWFVNGRSTANVAAVYEVGAGPARKLILKHDVADSARLHLAEFARHHAALADAPAFAERHLTAPAGEPIRVGDGSWITFQDVVGGSFTDYRVLSALLAGVPQAQVAGVDPRLVTACDRESFAAVCTAIVRGLLADWAGKPALEEAPVGEVLRRHLLHRLDPGQALHAEADRWPERRLDLPGEPRPLPNPFALMRDPTLSARLAPIQLVGRAHGDLHTENILVRTEFDPSDYHLIDLSRYEPDAPLTRDPVQLVLTILDRTMDERSDQQRELLLDLLVGDAADGRDMLPRWLPEFVDRVRDAQLGWVRPYGLSTSGASRPAVAVRLRAHVPGPPHLPRRHTGSGGLRLAARAAAAYLDGAGSTFEPGRSPNPRRHRRDRRATDAGRAATRGAWPCCARTCPRCGGCSSARPARRRGRPGRAGPTQPGHRGRLRRAHAPAVLRRRRRAPRSHRFRRRHPVVGEVPQLPLERPCGGRRAASPSARGAAVRCWHCDEPGAAVADGGRRRRAADRWRQALAARRDLGGGRGRRRRSPATTPRRLGLPPDGAGGWSPALLAAAFVLAWAAVGLLAPLLAAPVAALWLGRWPVGAGVLTSRRRDRWNRAHHLVERLAEAGASADSQARAMSRRAAIALALPRRPTWMGDRWTAVEQRVAGAYGLDLVTVWPRLWLALPESARAELRVAKADWDRSTQLAAWAGPFGALGLVWWPMFGVAAVVGVAGWLHGRTAVAYRADLIEAAFDLHADRLTGMLTGLAPDTGRRLTADLRKGT